MNYAAQIAKDGNLLARGSAPKRAKKRIPKVSKKRRTQLAFYAVARGEYMTAHPTCQYPGCMARSQDIHHRKGRIGNLLFDKRWFLAVCRPHHDHIHQHPSEHRLTGQILT